MKPFAVHCLARMGFGHKFSNSTNDIDEFMQLGADDDERLLAYLNQQLNWQTIDDSQFESMVAASGYSTLNKPLTQMWADHHVNSSVEGFNRDQPAEEMERLVVARALHSKRQLLEILADFWHNHFNIQSRSFYGQSAFTSWDRDVIRPPVAGHPRLNGYEHGHLLGNFRQMLDLSSKHVAMQYYLDNYINQRNGPNENYAREIIELHTLGAENYISLGDPAAVNKTDIPMPWGPGGTDVLVPIADQYVDDDVYAAMRMLTGWKIKDNVNYESSNNQDTGEFYYYEGWHDEFEKTILGYRWPNFSANPEDIIQFLDMIAYHPGTARHIAGKLCRRFISETPSQALIDEVANVFYQNRYAPNQLELVYRALFLSADFKNPVNFNAKLKRPFEAMVGAMRATGSDFMPKPSDSNTNTIMYLMERAGQRPFYWPAPNGFPDEKSFWMGGKVLIAVMRYYDWFIDKNNSNADRIVPLMDNTINAPGSDLPSHSPNNLAAFWMKKIFGYEPDGGWQGTDLHTKLRDFMRQNSTDPQQWPADEPLVDLAEDNYPYYFNDRMRGMVKILLSCPEFLYR